MNTTSSNPFFSNRIYNIFKWIAQIGLPALGVLYFALAQLWNFPNGTEVVGSITVVDTFLGVLLGVSTKAYNNSEVGYDGSIDVSENDNGKTYSLNLHADPESLDTKKQVIFKVRS